MEDVASSRISIGGCVSITRAMHRKLALALGNVAPIFGNYGIVAIGAGA